MGRISKIESHPSDEIIKDLYRTVSRRQLAIFLNESTYFVWSRMKKLGLVVTPEMRGKGSRYAPGYVHKSKGRKISEDERAMRSKYWFKKGHTPGNSKKDGDTSIRVWRSGCKYRFVRVSKGKWESEQKVVWERINGPVPKGFVLYHKDGDSLNNSIENLELVSRGQSLLKTVGHADFADKYVLSRLSDDKELQKELSKFPELIELKRNQLKLKRECRTVRSE